MAVESDEIERLAAEPAGQRAQTPEQILLRDTLDADLQAALDALPEAFRQAVWLRDVEEFTYAEIATMLDVPIGTVMSRISRGRRLLYERLTAAKVSLRVAMGSCQDVGRLITPYLDAEAGRGRPSRPWRPTCGCASRARGARRPRGRPAGC